MKSSEMKVLAGLIWAVIGLEGIPGLKVRWRSLPSAEVFMLSS